MSIAVCKLLLDDNQLSRFFWNKETLNPYKIYEPLLELAEEFYLEVKENFKKELEATYYPQLKLSPPQPVSTLKKKREYELLDLFEEMENKIKTKREEKKGDDIEKIWKRYREIEEDFNKEISRGLSL